MGKLNPKNVERTILKKFRGFFENLRPFQFLRSFFVSNNISLALIDRHPIDRHRIRLAIQLQKLLGGNPSDSGG